MKLPITLLLLAATASFGAGEHLIPVEKDGQCLCPRLRYSRDGVASAPLIFAGVLSQVTISTTVFVPLPWVPDATMGPPLGVDNVFQIKEIWKGPPAPDLHVYSSTGPCGVEFSPGKSYLIFAYRDAYQDTDERGYWTTNQCMTGGSTSSTSGQRHALGASSTPQNLSFISLKRSSGFTDSPDYDLTIMKSGAVFFRNHRSTSTVTLSATIYQSNFVKLMSQVNQSGFFDSWPRFEESGASRFDSPRLLICAASNGRYRCLERDNEPDVVPQAFLNLANHIDQASGVKKWISR